MKEEVEMKNDGHEAERFEALLKKVVNVPKDEIKKREKAERIQKRSTTSTK